MSTKEQQVQEMTNKIANFISYMAKVLPDDVQEKIQDVYKRQVPDGILNIVVLLLIYQGVKRGLGRRG